MPVGRIPGPYGLGPTYGCIFYPPALGNYRLNLGLDDFPHTTMGPIGTNADLGVVAATAAAAPSEDDKKELKMLQDIYGVLSREGKAYRSKNKKGKWQDDVAAYVKDRDAFFGSAAEYTAFKKTAAAELDTDSGKLRNRIEPPPAVRKKKADWNEAQNVFYSWVRKAYQNKHGGKVDVPKLIKSGTSEKLQKALQKVKVDYGKEFQSGGFNPRPMKLSGRYRLGTLSEHATGNAIDIESTKNAQITATVWRNILDYTGKSLDHASRKSQWKSKPEELHKNIKAINDEFVKKVAEAVKKGEEAAKAPAKPADPKAAPAPAAKAVDSLDAAIAKDEILKKIGKAFVSRWKNSFYSLEWALIKELHEEGFTWGATFGDPDLHHFEL